MFEIRSIQLTPVSGIWTVQRHEDTGTSVTLQVLSIHYDQPQGGTNAKTAKQLADAAAVGYQDDGYGNFSTSNDPFEL